MAEKRDYYEVLGVSKSASGDDIKKAYRTLAKKYHPDLHPDDKDCEEKFKEATEAFEVLSDPDKKNRYDQFGHAGVDPSYGGGGYSGGGGGFSDINDILSSFFGGGFGGGRQASPNAPRRGQDVSVGVTLTFMEACTGKKVDIRVKRLEKCEDCNGTGAAGSGGVETCSDCHGTGQVKTAVRTAFGVISQSRPCSRCGGKGKIIKTPCTKCGGQGRVRVERTLTVDIPAGIDDGQVLPFRGQGDAGVNNGPAGALNVGVSIKPDPIFSRQDYDVICDCPITFTQAVLGDTIDVPTIDGTVKINIPEGTQSNTTKRLRGKGIRRLNGRGENDRGDQYITLIVEIPQNLSKKQKELLKSFEASVEGKNYAKRQSFFEKLKDKFGQ